MTEKLNTKAKIINHLLVNGHKRTGEKIMQKSIKHIQKTLKSNSTDVVKLALINSLPTFKLHCITNKKQKKRNRKVRNIPAFLSNIRSRTSLSIKFIVNNLSKEKSKTFCKKLVHELVLDAKNQGSAVRTKNELQKQVILNKHFFTFYRWN